jgi:hypothetical protein
MDDFPDVCPECRLHSWRLQYFGLQGIATNTFEGESQIDYLAGGRVNSRTWTDDGSVYFRDSDGNCDYQWKEACPMCIGCRYNIYAPLLTERVRVIIGSYTSDRQNRLYLRVGLVFGESRTNPTTGGPEYNCAPRTGLNSQGLVSFCKKTLHLRELQTGIAEGLGTG